MTTFIAVLTRAVLAAILAACATSPSSPVATSAMSSGPAPRLRSLATFTSDAAGFDTHSYWLDTGREVVVFDAQFTQALANQLIAEIQATTTSPIRYVVVTHPNPDKFNGAPAFQAIGAKVVASTRTARAIPGVHAYKQHYFVNIAKMFTEATYPAQATIDLTFDGDLELPLEGDAQVKLHELAHAGVSTTQTVAFIPQLDALVVGDLVHHDAHAWLEGGISNGRPAPDLGSWKQALDELLAYRGATVYGGRGKPAKVDVAVRAEQAYLDRMNEIITSYVAKLGERKVELDGDQAGAHYKAIASLAAQAFPDHALPYLVEYGVYGLVHEVAAR